MMRTVISLGTNLGDREKNISLMTGYVSVLLLPPLKMSKVMETEPVGVPDSQQWYFNRILSGRYDGTARSLFEKCCYIEKELGRADKNTGKSRTADVDIVLIDDLIIQDPDFIIPHPQILNRLFCIKGIASIEPDWVHPVVKESFSEIAAHCTAPVINQKINIVSL